MIFVIKCDARSKFFFNLVLMVSNSNKENQVSFSRQAAPAVSQNLSSLDEIVSQIEAGDRSIDDLLKASQVRLLRLVSVRLCNQLKRRVDPEDIVQETFVVANKRFSEYLAQPKVPVFVWLRGLAIHRMVEAYRFHVAAEKRNVNREQQAKRWIDQSTFDLLDRIQANQKTPSQDAVARQRNKELRQAMEGLPDRYKTILILRFFESLTVAESAAAMEITETNAKVLQFRALKKLEELSKRDFSNESSDDTPQPPE